MTVWLSFQNKYAKFSTCFPLSNLCSLNMVISSCLVYVQYRATVPLRIKPFVYIYWVSIQTVFCLHLGPLLTYQCLQFYLIPFIVWAWLYPKPCPKDFTTSTTAWNELTVTLGLYVIAVCFLPFYATKQNEKQRQHKQTWKQLWKYIHLEGFLLNVTWKGAVGGWFRVRFLKRSVRNFIVPKQTTGVYFAILFAL